MKLNKFESYFPNRELGDLKEDYIYDKTINIIEIHKIKCHNQQDKLEDRLIFITVEDNEHYFFMPQSFNDSITDEDIENINNGEDFIRGRFKKTTTRNNRECWTFIDEE